MWRYKDQRYLEGFAGPKVAPYRATFFFAVWGTLPKLKPFFTINITVTTVTSIVQPQSINMMHLAHRHGKVPFQQL